MKKIFVIIGSVCMLSCNNEKLKGEFTVSGEIKNIPDQKIYLDEVFFNQSVPQTADSGKLENGKFSLKNVAAEEGIYRLRLAKGIGYIFINDQDKITATINGSEKSLLAADFNTPANRSLQKFITILDSLQQRLKISGDKVSALQQTKSADSSLLEAEHHADEVSSSYKNFIINYIDTTQSPVMALFALGYTQGIDPARIDSAVNITAKHFPQHQALQQLISQYKSQLTQNTKKDKPASNSMMAPDLTMADTSGKQFSLSSLRGKYVLVDFWASWCGPCRGENPNVVAAYNKYKNKNFTILGVSLDKEKSAWLAAIKSDGLTWHHISDLKYWNSAAVSLYNFDGIPYNVLIDPDGKIIATALRGEDLQNKLAEVLK